jgi:hypothetical protein
VAEAATHPIESCRPNTLEDLLEGLDWTPLMTDDTGGHPLVVQVYRFDRQGTDIDSDVGHPALPTGKGPCRTTSRAI